MEDKTPKSVLAAAIAKLEAEKQSRIDEKIAKGEAVRVPALSIVVGASEEIDAAIKDKPGRVASGARIVALVVFKF